MIKYEDLPTLNSPRWLSPKDLEGEIWKAIPNYDGYMASNYGRVKSIDRVVTYSGPRSGDHLHKGKVLRCFVNPHGYVAISLRGKEKEENRRVHQLVMAAFSEKPEGANQINHIDENKMNNCVYNLEYCTGIYNNLYGTKRERYRGKVQNDPKRSKPVIQQSLAGNFISTFPSLREAGRALGVQHGHIRDCCNGKLKTAYGYKWSWEG